MTPLGATGIGSLAATCLYLTAAAAVVTAPGLVFPLTIFVPAAWALFADRVRPATALVAGGVPLFLGVFPGIGVGAPLYGVLFVCGIGMRLYAGKRRMALAVAIPALVVFSATIAGMYAASAREGLAMGQMVGRWVEDMMHSSRNAAVPLLAEGDLEQFESTLDMMRHRIATLFPSIIAVGGALLAWLNLVVWARFRGDVTLRGFRVHDVMIAAFIITATLAVLPWSTPRIVGENALFVVCLVYLFQGLAVVAVFMESRAWPAVVRWAIYILIFVQLYMVVIVAGIGLFDAWFDFRARIQRTEGDDR